MQFNEYSRKAKEIVQRILRVSERILSSEPSEVAREDNHGHQVTHDGGNDNANQAWHHETVVQKVLAYHCGTCTVEVDRGDIRRIVRDEEVPVNARQNSQQNRPGNAEGISQRQHCDNHSPLRVDQHGDRKKTSAMDQGY